MEQLLCRLSPDLAARSLPAVRTSSLRNGSATICKETSDGSLLFLSGYGGCQPALDGRLHRRCRPPQFVLKSPNHRQ
jgi:hypothetical protein